MTCFHTKNYKGKALPTSPTPCLACMKTYFEAHPTEPVTVDLDADARRTVACVNACKGIPTQTLEDGHVILYHDLQQSNPPTHCFAGTLPELLQAATQLLRDQGYQVSDTHEPGPG